MARQKHDIGVQKRKRATQPMKREDLKKEREKRRHPGPLPDRLRDDRR